MIEKKTKVIDIATGVSKEIEVEQYSVSKQDANFFMQIVKIVLVDDDRLVPVMKHFMELINRSNENNTQ